MTHARLDEQQWLVQRAQVLEAFARQVRELGLRAVTMSGLAKSLGISTKTLYRHFSSRTELLNALVQDHMQAFNQRRMERLLRGENPHRRVELQSLEWLALQAELGETFFVQLAREYPQAYALYREKMRAFLNSARNTLGPELRKDLNAEHALKMLLDLIQNTPSYQQCEGLGMTRKQALVQAIDIWARGSLAMYVH